MGEFLYNFTVEFFFKHIGQTNAPVIVDIGERYFFVAKLFCKFCHSYPLEHIRGEDPEHIRAASADV